MNHEWDEAKRKENIRKHGFDFADAWEIFNAPMVINLDKRFDYGEDRWIGIGFLGDRVVAVVFTESDDATTRIISLRKAIKHERTKLEQKIRNRLGEN